MLIAYLAERLPPRLALPAAGLLALAASARGWAGSAAFAGDMAFALLLFAQFRIWDDLADRRRDCVAHPARALCRAASTVPAAAASAALALANVWLAASRDGFGIAPRALIALNAVFGVHYLLRRDRTIAGDHLLLSKYPAFVLVIAGSHAAAAPVPLSLAMAAVYLAACVYEAWHDPASPLSRHRRLVFSEAVLLVAALVVLFSARFPGGHA